MSDAARIEFKTKFVDSDPELFYRLGIAYGKSLKLSQIPIATVMESTSKDLIRAFVQGLQEHGKKPLYLGELSLDMFLFVMHKYGYNGGVIFVNDNSNLVNEFAAQLWGKEDVIVDINTIARELKGSEDYIPVNVPMQFKPQFDIYNEFVEYSLRVVKTNELPDLKIVVDSGNGIGAKSITRLLQKIPQLKVIPLHGEMDGTYPHHFPNPDISINTVELKEKIVELKADLGIAIGVEGTRVRFIDNRGEDILPQHLAGLLISKFLTDFPGKVVACEPSYKRMMHNIIEKYHGKGVYCSMTSDASPYEMMFKAFAIFGFDNQDNYYFATNHYHQSGIQAVLHVLEVLGRTKKHLFELIQPYIANYTTGNRITLRINENVSFQNVKDKLVAKYLADHVVHTDASVEIDYPDWRAFMRKSTHDYSDHKLRLYVEAKDGMLVRHIENEIVDYLSDLTKLYDEELHTIEEDIVNLSHREQALHVYNNYYYSWNRHSHSPTHPLYNTNWLHNPSPVKMIREMSDEEFNDYWEKNKKWIHLHLRHLDLYKHDYTYFKKLESIHNKLGILSNKPVAYFSMEFAISDWLQIYSGGLGVLAGDVLKQASDSGLPMVGVGIFYHQGYFHQRITEDGEQLEDYIEQKIGDYPFELAKRPTGEVAEIQIHMVDHMVFARAWVVNVGRNKLVLLDTNYEKNERWEDKMITAHLYGGDQDTRIRQEILIGIGGHRMLLAMGIDPSICHMNEGHSAFVQLSLAQKVMIQNKVNFGEALVKARKELVFTNHTLKTAGNDNFTYDLSKRYLTPFANELGIDFEEVWRLGNEEPVTQGKFSMTIAGMRGAKLSNAVSILHSQAAKKIWPTYNLIPITNGVHMPTWVARPIHQLLDNHVGERWHDPRVNVDFDKLNTISHEHLWNAHQNLKGKVVEVLNKELGLELNTEAILFSWFRRFAEYKRPDIIISDVNRLLEIVGNNQANSPIQFIIGGKAHPQDTQGQELLRRVYNELKRPEFKNKIVFIPGYNWRLAKLLVAGSDVWVNTPRRYEEASGTSGMKAAANGVLQMTTLDGWTDEVNWDKVGWVLPDHDPNTFFNIIQNQIIPTYYNRGLSTLPKEWVERMISTMKVVLNHYSTERMVDEYIRELYLPVLKDL